LAPDRVLFADWKEGERKEGHERAFELSRYQERFTLSPDGLESLRRLADVSRKREVFLACQCEIGERCHREMLLLTAKERFGAEIGRVFHSYPVYEERLKKK
jgi:hypothetical protein